MEYEVSLQTISWLNNRRNEQALEISPLFQRRAVWIEKERSELIDTICIGLPFPEVYVQVVTEADTGRQNHIVVDGQQRVTSILMFIDGEISLPTVGAWNGEYFRDLSPEIKEAFWDYKIVVRNLRKTSDAEIRDLFERLNTNTVALNDQEIRNAKYVGVFKQLAERLADSPTFQEIGLFTARDIRRMVDVEFASELLILTIQGISNKKDLVESYYARFEEELPGAADYESQFISALTLLWSIFDPSSKMAFKTKSNFYTLFGCMLKYHNSTNRNSFENPRDVQKGFVDFINKAKNQEFDENNPKIEEYADAVSRAASDRGRRARREHILWEIVAQIEGIEQADAPNA
jgi:hypothetical protein